MRSAATAAIDAPAADPIIAALKERGWTLSEIFVTHKHFDHIEGIPALQAAYDCAVVGPEASAAETGMYDRTVKDGDSFEWAGRKVEVIETPGHTLDHISLHLPEEKLVFVGDTVFSLGCGRVIEGDHAMMWDSIKAIRALPDDTQLYCGHEYTLANARFALSVDPNNAALKARAAEVEKLSQGRQGGAADDDRAREGDQPVPARRRSGADAGGRHGGSEAGGGVQGNPHPQGSFQGMTCPAFR